MPMQMQMMKPRKPPKEPPKQPRKLLWHPYKPVLPAPPSLSEQMEMEINENENESDSTSNSSSSHETPSVSSGSADGLDFATKFKLRRYQTRLRKLKAEASEPEPRALKKFKNDLATSHKEYRTLRDYVLRAENEENEDEFRAVLEYHKAMLARFRRRGFEWTDLCEDKRERAAEKHKTLKAEYEKFLKEIED